VEDEDDGKYEIFERQFSKSLKNLIARELPAGDEFMGFE